MLYYFIILCLLGLRASLYPKGQDPCSFLCELDPECGAKKRDSYCKQANEASIPVCQAYYHLTASKGSGCFIHTHGNTNEDTPLLCSEAEELYARIILLPKEVRAQRSFLDLTVLRTTVAP
jgi:hypothetical protein